VIFQGDKMTSNYRRKRFPIAILLGIVTLYVVAGDSVLPGQAGYYSYYARTSLNNMLIKAFPGFKQKNPNQRTEDAIKQMDK
jgi:hypothetical protein